MATVASLVVSLSADSEAFTSGVNKAGGSLVSFSEKTLTTQQALRAAGQLFDQTRTPTERYGQDVARLDALMKAGTLTQDVYTRALAQSTQRLDAASSSTKQLGSFTAVLATRLIGLSAVARFANNAVQELETLRTSSLGNASGEDVAAAISVSIARSIPFIREIHEGLSGVIEQTSAWITGTKTAAEELKAVKAAMDASFEKAAKIESLILNIAKAQRSSSADFFGGRAATAADQKLVEQKFALQELAQTYAALHQAVFKVGLDQTSEANLHAQLAASEQVQAAAIKDRTLGLFEYQRALQTVIDTAGLSADAIKLKELADLGASQAALADVAAMQKQADAAKKLSEAMTNARGLIDDWRDALVTTGLNARDAQLALLQALNATAQNDALTQQIETLKALDGELDALEKRNKLMDEGKRLTKEMATPMEAFAQKLRELQELRGADAITQEIFERAVKDAEARLNSAAVAHAPEIRLPKLEERRFVAGFDPQRFIEARTADPQRDMAKDTRSILKKSGDLNIIQSEARDLLRRLADQQPVQVVF